MRNIVYNGTFEYQPHPNILRNPTVCYLLVIRQPGDDTYLAIATELKSNPGVSIDNSISALATAIVKCFDEKPERFTFIEHFSDSLSYGGLNSSRSPDCYSRVEYTWLYSTQENQWVASKPKNTYISLESVYEMLGVRLLEAEQVDELAKDHELVGILEIEEKRVRSRKELVFPLEMPEVVSKKLLSFKVQTLQYARVAFLYGVARSLDVNLVKVALCTGITLARFYALPRAYSEVI